MINEDIKTIIEQATINIMDADNNPRGRCVLVPGGLILTAGHCLNIKTTGELALGDYHIETLQAKTFDSSNNLLTLKAAPAMIEPVTDIAALEKLDEQAFFEEAEQFEEFCENTKPVPLFNDGFEIEGYQNLAGGDFPIYKPFDVFVYTHEGFWIAGKAKLCPFQDIPFTLWVSWGGQIKGGTSGSPIVNNKGELIGIVSHAKDAESHDIDGFMGDCIFLLEQCLPKRIWQQITKENE
jgi:hypothetical protein